MMFVQNYSKIYQCIAPNIILGYVRKLHESYYEILGVSRTCSTKEIKAAFIKLSKIHHPDTSSEKDGSESRFVQVLEAYNVLSKPKSRNMYDYQLQRAAASVRHKKEFDEHSEFVSNQHKGYAYDDPNFWANRAKTHYEEKPYYGIKGINRVTNGTIAFFCVVFSTIGAIAQFFAIRHSVTFKRDKLIKRSDEYKQIIEEIEKQVAKNGQELQIELIQNRLKSKSGSRSDKK